jgi:hypothetical protein
VVVVVEWKAAIEKNRRFDISVLTSDAILARCESIKDRHADWPAIMSSADLSLMAGTMAKELQWWRPDDDVPMAVEDADDDIDVGAFLEHADVADVGATIDVDAEMGGDDAGTGEEDAEMDNSDGAQIYSVIFGLYMNIIQNAHAAPTASPRGRTSLPRLVVAQPEASCRCRRNSQRPNAAKADHRSQRQYYSAVASQRPPCTRQATRASRCGQPCGRDIRR